MLEQSLHAGNIAASFGAVATAADITFCGGAATTIGAALSSVALYKDRKTSAEIRSLSARMAPLMQSAFDRQGLSGDRKKLVAQTLLRVDLTEADLVDGKLTAAIIAANLRNRIHDTSHDPEIRDSSVLDPFEAIVRETLEPVLATKEITEATQGLVNQKLLAGQDELLKRFEAFIEKSEEVQSARESGVTDAQIIALAQEIADDISDTAQAFRELEVAVEDAKEFRARVERGSNADGVVADLLRRLQDLVDDGRLRDAQAEADATLAQWERDEADRAERAKQTHIELIDAAIARDLEVRDEEAAAAKLIRKADLEAGGRADFKALRAIQDEWQVRGRDRGLARDQEVGIALARIVLTRAEGPDQRGAALNDLGLSLWERGARETGTDRLEEAVTAFRAALEEWTRDRVPLDWARTQMNLGTALATLGTRETGTDRLEEAVTAFRAALEERTRDRVPLDWARTQTNLGTALATLGTRETGTDRLEEAVTAFRAALEEVTRDRVPLDWAMTQMNLGIALRALGERETGTDRLEEAVTAYRAALEEWTRDRVPLDWATTQNNLGNALQTLGERETGTDRLEEAVTAYRAALEEWTRDRVPLDWATTQNNLGNALQTLGERETGTDRLEEAVTAFRAALEEWTRDRVPLQWARAQMNLGTALATLGTRETGTDRLNEAVTAYRAALEELTRERVPLDWANTLGNEASALLPLAERTGDLAMARRALDQYRTAEAELLAGGHAAWAATFTRQIPVAEALVAKLSGTSG